MKSFAIPKSPISNWDRVIMHTYPYCYELNRTGIFDEARDYAHENFVEGSFTWKGPKFFFKNEQDYTWFMLRWE